YGNGLAVVLVGPTGGIAIAGDGERKIGGARDVIGLAVVESFELRQCIGVLFDQLGEFVHQVAALRSGELFAPGAVVESGAGGGDGFVHISGIGFSDVGDGFAGGGIDGRKGFAGRGVGPFVVDEQLGGAGFKGWFNG